MFRLSSLIALALAWMVVSGVAASDEKNEAPALHFLSPFGTEAVDSAAAAAMLGHYGKPPGDCEKDEKAFQISGVPGMVRDRKHCEILYLYPDARKMYAGMAMALIGCPCFLPF
jgi:hypothetical protein